MCLPLLRPCAPPPLYPPSFPSCHPFPSLPLLSSHPPSPPPFPSLPIPPFFPLSPPLFPFYLPSPSLSLPLPSRHPPARHTATMRTCHSWRGGRGATIWPATIWPATICAPSRQAYDQHVSMIAGKAEEAYDQHLNMILGEAEEVVTTVEIDDETYEEIVKVGGRGGWRKGGVGGLEEGGGGGVGGRGILSKLLRGDDFAFENSYK
ncbi:unnamed protein product [Closterium sp. NIES-65]|nr:unnamed protein product [Closterium sp. NIES-65]